MGSDYSSGGSDLLWGEDVCRFRGQGCNQTAGRLPRLLSSTAVDAGVRVLHLEAWLRGIWHIYTFVCLYRFVGVLLVSP